jgi:hypothetical protein
MIEKLMAKLNPQQAILLDNYKKSLIAKRKYFLDLIAKSPKKLYKRQLAKLDKLISEL